MQRLFITRLKAENIAKIKDIDIEPNGGDVYITGQNGSGKSTVKKAIDWVMSGNTYDGEKLITYGGSEFPLVEIELTDGKLVAKLSKEIVQTTRGNKISRSANCYLNGLPATQKELNEFFAQYVPIDALPFLLNPFEFFKLDTDVKRILLTELFGNVTDKQVLESCDELAEFDFKNVSKFKPTLKSLKNESRDIPIRISEIKSQLKDVESRDVLDAEIKALEQQKREIEVSLYAADDDCRRMSEGLSNCRLLERDAKQIRSEIDNHNLKINELRAEYRKVKNRQCPYCKQKLTIENVSSTLVKIVEKGTQLREHATKLAARLAEVEKDIAALKESSVDYSVFDSARRKHLATLEQRDALQNEIIAREKRISAIEYQTQLNEKNKRKIESLTSREKELGEQISYCEKQIALAEKFKMIKAEMISDAINSHFQNVTFQMFETSKSGEINNACVAMMDGVPYEFLSKGEKLKAALDVLTALQNYYQVEFPLIIDDAESYTSNSIEGFPDNQKFILQVVEGQNLDVKITFGEKGARSK